MKKWVIMPLLGMCLFGLFKLPLCYGVEVAPRISDREIIESLTRLEEGVQTNRNAIEELKSEVGALRNDLKSEVETLRKDLKSEIGTLRTELKSEVGVLRTELKSEVGALRNELRVGLKSEVGALRNEILALRTELLGFLKWGFGLLFSGMFILISFILWDRRSVLNPVKDKIDSLESKKVDRVIAAMKKLSDNDSQMAQALRSVGLL